MIVPLEQKDMLWSFIEAHLRSRIRVFLSGCGLSISCCILLTYIESVVLLVITLEGEKKDEYYRRMREEMKKVDKDGNRLHRELLESRSRRRICLLSY
ncbi:hypothetical protein CRG98_011554 [Punica granatum]|uniref:Uncharacterized protein n=1 Tax=Punica granatum TaxID=22663 RepID=A0A2I0KHJ1_PUNGR|nr:hypothetical protein CRG98_011554 [Punica granatum]